MSFAGITVPREHEPIVLHGKFVNHPKYGQQFEVASMEHDKQLDATGLANYLSNNPDIKGIGPVKAKAVAEKFASNFERVLIDTPELIAETAHVPLSVVVGMRDRWTQSSHINAAMTALSAYGLTHNQVTRLVSKLGDNAVGIMEHNPYVLIGEIEGFGFKRIDKIARQVGTAKNDPNRIRACIMYCVDEALERGDCWIELEDLLTKANSLLVMDCLQSKELIESHLDYLIDHNNLACYSTDSLLVVVKPAILQMEADLVEIFSGGRGASPHKIKDFSKQCAMLNNKQRQAVDAAFGHSISLICGGAGVGKTFTIRAITDICEANHLSFALCAPTGKAARRMEESTGRPAQTIHRLLGYSGQGFEHSAETPLVTDVLVVDECSMVDVLLASRLFQAICLSRTAVVLVGDHSQLPPVGPGNILRDLISTKVLPTTILDQVVRQAGILKENSIAVLTGIVPKTPPREHPEFGAWYVVDQYSNVMDVQNNIRDIFTHVLNQRLGFDILRDVQLLTPTHKGPLGTVELNSLLQKLIQSKLWGNEITPTPPERRPKLYKSDKVIQTRNNYNLDIMNGSIGIVKSAGSDGSLSIEFESGLVEIEAGSPERNDIQLAYALTIHRAQGSEYPCSMVVIHSAHSFMHHRNLLYTGVTRASKTAIIIGDTGGIANCAHVRHVDERRTLMPHMLDKE